MKNSLKNFIANNRDQFDDKLPSDKVWSRISDTVFEEKSLWNSVVIWRSAAVLLLCACGYLLFTQPGASTSASQVAAQQDFSDIESFYTDQITEKIELISKEGRFEDDSFTQDLEKLEATYTVLAEEMKKHPSDKVKDALVLTMLVRIDLLNQQIHKLEQSKEKEVEDATI